VADTFDLLESFFFATLRAPNAKGLSINTNKIGSNLK